MQQDQYSQYGRLAPLFRAQAEGYNIVPEPTLLEQAQELVEEATVLSGELYRKGRAKVAHYGNVVAEATAPQRKTIADYSNKVWEPIKPVYDVVATKTTRLAKDLYGTMKYMARVAWYHTEAIVLGTASVVASLVNAAIAMPLNIINFFLRSQQLTRFTVRYLGPVNWVKKYTMDHQTTGVRPVTLDRTVNRIKLLTGETFSKENIELIEFKTEWVEVTPTHASLNKARVVEDLALMPLADNTLYATLDDGGRLLFVKKSGVDIAVFFEAYPQTEGMFEVALSGDLYQTVKTHFEAAIAEEFRASPEFFEKFQIDGQFNVGELHSRIKQMKAD